MGNKKKLVQKGLCDLFPQNINQYYEPFSGSCVVAMNTKANCYNLNDSNIHLYQLYRMFCDYTSDEIITHVEKRIDEFNLPRERTKRNEYHDKDKIEEYKVAYHNFRNYYNDDDNYSSYSEKTLDFYTLTMFSFSQQFRFNSKDEYNMPFGNDCFSEKNKNYIRNGCNFFNKPFINVSCQSFDNFLYDYDEEIFKEDNVFVYFDPPYANTTAVYNESRGSEFTWNDGWELRLRDVCEDLTAHNIKFAMSNVFANKDFVNHSLKNWCKRNGYNVHHFNHSYTACGKGNAKTDEVLIMNY